MYVRMMISGSVGIYQHETEWHPSKVGCELSCEVKIDGKPHYSLHYIPFVENRKQTYRYELRELDGEVLQTWKPKKGWLRTRLDLSLSRHALVYNSRWPNRRSFRSATEKFLPYFTIHENSKTAEIDGMEFEQIDYETEIHFTCPENRVPQAIMVANLIFNSPVQVEKSPSQE